MKYNKSISIVLLIFLFTSCKTHDKKGQIASYFEKIGWKYPLHEQSSDPLVFKNNFFEDEVHPIRYDTSSLIRFEDAFLQQAIEYFEKQLPIDSTIGYVVEKPIIYRDDSIVYSIGVKKFKLNNTRTAMPCQGCQAIENNTIFVSSNRAVFKVKTGSIIEFRNWID